LFLSFLFVYLCIIISLLKILIMSKESSSSGISFMGMLTILFIALKLTNYVDWSWWWVLSPIWLGFLLAVFAGLLVVLIEKNKKL
jgi:hypothetical protein